MVETQFHTRIQILKIDNGREFFQSQLNSFLQEKGIIHLSLCVDTPQQNGVAERKNRNLLEVTRSLMLTTHVPKMFWGEAMLTATFLINRMPSRVLQFQTPHKKLLETYPHFRLHNDILIKIFGCTTFIHVHHHLRSKLDSRAIKCIFLGYSST